MSSDYAELCFKMFGDRVKNWLPSTSQGSAPLWCMTMASMCRGGALGGLQEVTPGQNRTLSHTISSLRTLWRCSSTARSISLTRRGGLGFCWILCGTNLKATSMRIKLQHLMFLHKRS